MSPPPEAIPMPPGRPIVGNLFDLDMKGPTQSMARLAREYGPIYRLRLPAMDMVVVTDPKLTAELGDEELFPKCVHGSLVPLKDIVGDGLFTAETDSHAWQKGHRILRGLFSMSAVQSYHATMVEITEEMLDHWQSRMAEEIVVTTDITKLAVDIIFKSCAGQRLSDFGSAAYHPLINAIAYCFQTATNRSVRPAFVNKLIGFFQTTYKKNREYIFSYVDNVIDERLRLKDGIPDDMLTLLLNTPDPETGEKFTPKEIRDQLLTLLLAGHETTKGVLSFGLNELAQSKEAYAKLRDEVVAVAGSDFRKPPTYEAIAKMKYLENTVKELVRLWPTVMIYAVRPVRRHLLAGRWPVDPSQNVVVLLEGLHQDREFWGKDAGEFRPERWETPRIRTEAKYAYQPWGRGKRSCTGRLFAAHELKVALAMILQRFDFTTNKTSRDIERDETLSITPKDLRIKVRLREEPAAVLIRNPKTVSN